MNRSGRSLLFLLAFIPLFLAACSAPGEAGGVYSGTLVLEGEHVFESGEQLRGALVVLDGQVRLAPGARVEGPVVLLGGSLRIEGQVQGDASAIGGQLSLGPEAHVTGDVRVGNGQLERAPQARVEGRVLTGVASGLEPGDLFPQRSTEIELLWAVPEAILLASLAYLAGRYARRPVERVRRAALRHTLVSAAMGLLAGVVGLVLLVVIAYTLILLPVTVMGLAAGFLAIGYGWAGVGLAVGRRLAAWRGWSFSTAQMAALGTFIFALALNLVTLIPFIGGTLGILAAAVSLGAVVLTRFGLREFVPEAGWQAEAYEENHAT